MNLTFEGRTTNNHLDGGHSFMWLNSFSLTIMYENHGYKIMRRFRNIQIFLEFPSIVFFAGIHVCTGWRQICPPPGTLLQLSPPKYEFWAAKNGTCLPFSFLFSGHQNKNHSAQTWGLGCFFWTTASQKYLVGFNLLTILSGQGHISELIAQHSHFSDDRSS